MKARACAAAVLAALVIGQPGAMAQGTAITPAAQTSLASYLSQAVDHGAVPGVVAGVVDRDGVLFQAVAGKLDVANDVDMSADTIFRIQSMTKPITSVAAMMLVEEGRLNLDEEVATYLPAWKDRQVLDQLNADGTYTTRPPKRPLTIRHLMSHTSGIAYAFSNPVATRLLEGTTKTELDLPLLTDPGERWMYSPSTRVVGQVIEKITGQPLDEVFQTRIFGPLGMVDSGFAVPPEKRVRVATVHQRTNGVLFEQPVAAVLQGPPIGDAGLYSTAHDYEVFLRMLLNGGSLNGVQFLRPETVASMGQNQIGDLFVQEQPGVNTPLSRPFPIGSGRDKFGLGFQIAQPDERFTAYRTPGSLSWAGGPNTHFWIDPQRGIAAVLLLQMFPFYDDVAISTLRDFEQRVYAGLQ
jgi:CubicO group peptidase (beta-lactamase class C family)